MLALKVPMGTHHQNEHATAAERSKDDTQRGARRWRNGSGRAALSQTAGGGDAITKRRRSDDQAPEGAPAPSQARPGDAGIPWQELPVGKTVPLEEPQGGLSRQDLHAQRQIHYARPEVEVDAPSPSGQIE